MSKGLEGPPWVRNDKTDYYRFIVLSNIIILILSGCISRHAMNYYLFKFCEGTTYMEIELMAQDSPKLTG